MIDGVRLAGTYAARTVAREEGAAHAARSKLNDRLARRGCLRLRDRAGLELDLLGVRDGLEL